MNNSSFMRTAFFFLYELLWRLVIPFLRRNKRLAEGFSQRISPKSLPPKKRSQRIWLQAASGGEAHLACKLVHEMLTSTGSSFNGQEIEFFCSSCTSQGLQVLLAGLDDISKKHPIYCDYFPFDAPSIMSNAVSLFQVDILILLETELWPGLFQACTKAFIPTLIINARMRPSSFKAYKFLNFIWENSYPQKVLAISKEDSTRFSSLFAQAQLNTTMKNIKFDLAHDALLQRSSLQQERKDKNDLIANQKEISISFVSIRKEEEEDIFSILSLLKNSYSDKNITIRVAPRHMHRVAAWESFLQQENISYSKRSDKIAPSNTQKSFHFELWDTFGELALLYEQSLVCFVGGTLAPLGGQNFLEPLSYGLDVVIGPFYDNFLWVGEDIFSLDFFSCCHNKEEITEYIKEKIVYYSQKDTLDPLFLCEKHEHRRTLFKEWLEAHLGGTQQACSEIVQSLCNLS